MHDAILTLCLFNFMTRLLEGHGVKGDAERYGERGLALKEADYAPLIGILDAMAPPSARG